MEGTWIFKLLTTTKFFKKNSLLISGAIGKTLAISGVYIILIQKFSFLLVLQNSVRSFKLFNFLILGK